MSSQSGHSLGFEIQRFNSPPPKPPRRRHSDQSSKLSGGRKKHVDGNLLLNNKVTTDFDSGASGYESLPASWMLVNNDYPELNGTKASTLSHLPLSRGESHCCKTGQSGNETCPDRLFCNLSNSLENESSINPPPILPHHPPLERKCSMLTSAINQNPGVSKAVVKREVASELSGFALHDSDSSTSEISKGFTAFHRRHNSDSVLLKRKMHLQNCADADALYQDLPNASHCNQFNVAKSLSNSDSHFLAFDARYHKETNDMLWKHICLLQGKLDNMLTVSKKVNDQSPSFSDFLADIYNAQKEKDIAFESHLQLIAEQRDTAIKELQEVLRYVTRNFERGDLRANETNVNEQNTKEFFQEIEMTQNPGKLLQHQRCLAAKGLSYQTNDKLHCLSRQLNLALKEKKEAVEKAENLEQELMKWKNSRCQLHSDAKRREASWLDALCFAIAERDSAVSKAHHLQEQIQALQFHHSSCQVPRPSTNDVNNLDCDNKQMFDAISSLHDAPSYGEAQGNSIGEDKSTISDDMAEEVRSLKCQVSHLTKQLECERKLHKSSEEKCQKLDYIIRHLRKKLND